MLIPHSETKTSLPPIEFTTFGTPIFTQPLPNESGWWFQPLWKILVKMGIFPQIGVKVKHCWNHHLVHNFIILTSLLSWKTSFFTTWRHTNLRNQYQKGRAWFSQNIGWVSLNAISIACRSWKLSTVHCQWWKRTQTLMWNFHSLTSYMCSLQLGTKYVM